MAVREHQLGEGTIKYRGESREYYLSKAGLWRKARWVIAGILAVLGLMFVVASSAQVVQATVGSVSAPDDMGRATATLVTPDGSSGTAGGLESLLPEVGDTVTVMVLPGGRVVLGDYTEQGRITGIAFLLIALGMVLWGIRQDRVRGTGPRITGPVDPRIGDGDQSR